MKKKAIAIQIDHATKERNEAHTLFNLDLEIKKQLLKQEKLKTRMILLELRKKRKKQ